MVNTGRGTTFKDITGERFGRLTAVEFAGVSKENRALWRCKCDCGNTVVVSGKSLRNGNTKSCGCLSKDLSTERIVAINKKHGETGTRLWRIWSGMLSRCNSPSNAKNPSYQMKGVAVCEEWLEYESFRDWALASGYADGLSIDRIDVNGNYEPDNCRWATAAQQAENRSSSHMFTVDGKTKCLAAWSRSIGLSKDALGVAIKGKSEEEAQAIVEEYVHRGCGKRKRRKLWNTY